MRRLVVVFLILICSFTACEPSPNVKIEDGMPPTFQAGGSEEMYEFYICCQNELDRVDEDTYLWKLVRQSDSKAGLSFKFNYGEVPEGYKQTIPKNNEPPMNLVSGRKYSYFGLGMHGGRGGCFEVRDNKITTVECDRSSGQLTAEIVAGESTPILIIKGDDYLYEVLIRYFRKRGDDPYNWPNEYAWQIRPKLEYKRKLPITIKYGQLPDGYQQITPADNAAPIELKEGIKYYYDISGNHSSANGCFKFVQGRIEKTKCGLKD